MAASGLERHVAKMRDNLAVLKNLNVELGSDLEALRSDPDRARREARALGYLARGEYEVVIVGARETARERPSTGTVIPYEVPPSLADEVLKVLALAAAMLGFVFGSRAEEGRGRTPLSARTSAAPRRSSRPEKGRLGKDPGSPPRRPIS